MRRESIDSPRVLTVADMICRRASQCGKAGSFIQSGVGNSPAISGAERMGRTDGIERGESVGCRKQGMDRCDSGRNVCVGQLCTLDQAILSLVERDSEDVRRLCEMSAGHRVRKSTARTGYWTQNLLSANTLPFHIGEL